MFEQRMNALVQTVNDALDRLLPAGDTTVRQAMRYSCRIGGKRVRPVLLLESCRLCGGDEHAALTFACALEMIHTYSLIHDDLPCMDDDDLRRGQPACHKQFGEAFALLAGDALLTRAFEACLSAPFAVAQPERTISAVRTLADAAGVEGMIGGQEIDLQSEGQTVSLDTLRTMDEKKTGALIRAACAMGAILSNASEEQRAALDAYARDLGQAFQIVDDILDVEGTAETLGKPIGSDAESEKSTYVSLLGLERAKREALTLTRRACDTLDIFGEDGAFLRELAERLCRRTN